MGQWSAWKACLSGSFLSCFLEPLGTSTLSCLLERVLAGWSAPEAFYIIPTLNVCGPSSLHHVTGNNTKFNTPHCTLKLTLRETNTPRSLNKCSAYLQFNLI